MHEKILDGAAMRRPNPIGVDEDHPSRIVSKLGSGTAFAVGCLAEHDRHATLGGLAPRDLDAGDERIDIRCATGVEQEASERRYR